MDERSWKLASLGYSHGGMGLRDPAQHADAAYLACIGQTRDLCKAIDERFDVNDDLGGLAIHATTEHYLQSVLEPARQDLMLDDEARSQRWGHGDGAVRTFGHWVG